MHEPIGLSGVQTVPNSLHRWASWRRAGSTGIAALGVARWLRHDAETRSASKSASASSDTERAVRELAEPRHRRMCAVPAPRDKLLRLQVAFAGHDADILVLDLVAASFSWRSTTASPASRRTGRNPRSRSAARFFREIFVRSAANHCTHMRWREKASMETPPLDPALSENGLQRGRGQHVVAEHGEILEAFRLCLFDRNRGWRRGRLEADGEEHHVPAWVLARNLQRVIDGIDHADVGAAPLSPSAGFGAWRREPAAYRHSCKG